MSRKNAKGRGAHGNSTNRSYSDMSEGAPPSFLLPEEYSTEESPALSEVRDLNLLLKRQMDVLELMLDVNDKNFDNEKNKVIDDRASKSKEKDAVIEDLKDDHKTRDGRITHLVADIAEKDQIITSKFLEIEDLTEMVRKIKQSADQFKLKSRAEHELGNEKRYTHEEVEIEKLNEEIKLLKTRLVTVERQLQEASKVIAEQDNKIQKAEDKTSLQLMFKEELHKATQCMRDEVAKIEDEIQKNSNGLRKLAVENKALRASVNDLDNYIRTSVGIGERNPNSEHKVFLESSKSASTNETKNQLTVGPTAGLGKMNGSKLNYKERPSSKQGHTLQVPESSQLARHDRPRKFPSSDTSSSDDNFTKSTENSELLTSPDDATRSVFIGQTPRGDNKYMPLNIINMSVDQTNSKANDKLAPNCTIKSGVAAIVRQPPRRGGRIQRGVASKK